jgi:hypothetical protein
VSTYGLAIEVHGECERLEVLVERLRVLGAFETLLAWWKPIHQQPGDVMLDKRRPCANTNCRTTGEQNLLKGQRTVIVVREVSARPRATGGLEQLFPAVMTVVDLDVAWEQFRQVLEQLRTMAILGVDQQ